MRLSSAAPVRTLPTGVKWIDPPRKVRSKGWPWGAISGVARTPMSACRGPEGQALTDAERFKGNPAPGSGSGPAKYLEQHKMVVKFAPIEYDLNYDKYLRKYLAALGLPVT